MRMVRSLIHIRAFSAPRYLAALFLMLFGLAIGSDALAADLLLTDIQGNRIALRGVRIAYEKRAFGPYRKTDQFGQISYVRDQESVFQDTGIKVHQGDGQVLINWTRIQKIIIKGLSSTGSSVQAQIMLRGDAAAELVPVELVNPVDTVMGDIPLGRFSIELHKIATLEPLTSNQQNATSSEMKLTGITVTDRKGVSVSLKVPDHCEMPALPLGAGSVAISFERIEKVDIRPADARKVTIGVQTDGQGRMQFTFEPFARRLEGESNLGAFSILWSEIDNIVSQREKTVKK
jgi:hypothetical protein